MIQIAFPVAQADIKAEVKRVSDAINANNAEMKILQATLGAIRNFCTHEHPKTGWNERDGSWASPCIHCGYSY